MENQTESESSLPKSGVESLINICVEGWRFARVYTRAVSKLDASQQSKYLSPLNYFLKQIEDNLKLFGVSLVAFEGQPFDPRLPIKAINLSDFNNNDRLIIDVMLEPVVMGKTGLLRMGSAILKRVDL
ncbi:MAG: hypothetical protein FJ135_04285 [Deltaproteobacteria bacterium]|nr:hypothetical protein [Deltaproteobacteria bacterium]